MAATCKPATNFICQESTVDAQTGELLEGLRRQILPDKFTIAMQVKADIEIEKKLLSALMLKNGVAISEAVEVLTAEDFYRPEHRLIYRALVKLNAAGRPLDILLVERELELSDDLKRVTRSYLYGLLNLEHTTGRVPGGHS